MNEGLNDFLARMGIEQTASDAAMETVEPSPEVQEAVDVIVEEGPPIIAESRPPSLSDEDVDNILSEWGFEDSLEESEENVEEEEDNTEGPLYVGDGIMAQVRDSMQPMRLTVTDAGIIADDGALIMSREMMDAVESGQDIDRTTAAADADRWHRWNTAVDRAVGSDSVHLHMPDGSVTDVPIVNEGNDTADTLDTQHSTRRAVREEAEEETIPENSPTLLIDDTTSRFSGAEWYDEVRSHRIIVGGVGGIGSWLSLQLARMHPSSMVIYDDDTVEEANMSGQLYRLEDSGKKKVRALKDIINSFTMAYNIYADPIRFTEGTEAGNVMMCGFDNMEARKIFFNKWRAHVMNLDPEERKKCLYLDGRLSISVLQVFCITGEDEYNMKKYEDEYLFNDSEAEATVCSMKQTTYMACMIGSFMVNLYTNWCANNVDPAIPYDLPFFTEYDAQNMLFKTVV